MHQSSACVVGKAMSAIFIKFLFIHQMIALQKLQKKFFFNEKSLFVFKIFKFL